MAEPLRVLVVEDSENDTRLLVRELKRAGYDVSFERVETAGSMRSALESRTWDLVIADYTMPSFSAPAALSVLQQSGLDLPFIIVSGSIGEDVAVEAMRAGAHDYLLKGNLTRLLPAVQRELAQAAQRRAGRQAEEALRGSERRYRLLFEKNPQPMWVFDEKLLTFLAINQAACRHYGYSHEEFLGMTIRDIRPAEDVPALLEQIAGESRNHEELGGWRHRRKDGTVIEVEITSDRLIFGGREARLVLAIDVTEKKQLEEQLRLSQKMEAVGQLAGGVAHDFNNLLTVILGFGNLLAARLASDASGREEVEEILRAAERAAALTQQLLAFSRKQVLEPVVLEVNELVRNLEKMLRRLVGEDLELATGLDPSAGRVRADPGQLEQVIVNLVVNARDAMPRGGKLTIETANADFDEAYAQHHASVRRGRYVMVAVRDTGVGMDAETQARIFEPFFTTKAKGKGTGLGLSTVYGIVKQSGGNIWVTSEPGKGTTLEMYLPRVDDVVADGVPLSSESLPAASTETILLVEDEESVRTLSRRVLEKHGYRVLEASSGEAALEKLRECAERIHLLLTDLVMPAMAGTELASRLKAEHPDLRVLFMSGYTDDAIVRSGLLSRGHAFLQKPFTPSGLVRKVRDVLSSADSP